MSGVMISSSCFFLFVTRIDGDMKNKHKQIITNARESALEDIFLKYSVALNVTYECAE